MSKYLAIDWDCSEARLLYASARGSQLRILALESVPLSAAAERSEGETAAELGARLRAALERHNIGRLPALVCIERRGLELLSLSLPPAVDAELPELVANEVLRESTAAADGAAFDFLAFRAERAAPRKVLAVVLPSEQHKQIEATAEAAQLRLHRLLPRSFAAAAMFQRLAPTGAGWHLLVHPGAEEVDFLVFRAGQIVFARTARLPSSTSDDDRDDWLESEVRRTITVATSEASEAPIVEGVYVFGARDEYLRLCERVRQGLLLPAHHLNPVEKYEIPANVAAEHPGRFAALLGMILDEAEKRPPAVDFLHPHRPPRHIGRMKMAALAAAVVLLASVFGSGYVWRNLSYAGQVNKKLADELKQLDSRVRDAAKTRRQAAAIRAWQAGDLVWLEELREFSERFPPARDALVLRMQLTAAAAGGGTIAFQGLVREPSLVVRLEYALRDAHHTVQSRRIQTGSRPDEDFTRLFDASVAITKRTRQEYLDSVKSR